MRIESEIGVARPQQEVFDYLARAEHMPEYVTEFESVAQTSEGEPGAGTQYRYKMARGAEGTFQWTEFEVPARLAWQGPAVKAGPGSMQPGGWWELTPSAGGTNVKLVMAPAPGGLFKVLAPFLAAGVRKNNQQALERLKQKLEARPA